MLARASNWDLFLIGLNVFFFATHVFAGRAWTSALSGLILLFVLGVVWLKGRVPDETPK